MKKLVWGPYIWTFLHCFTMRIKEEYFEEEKKNIIDNIFKICNSLPCPLCAIDATEYLKKHNFKLIKTKNHLITIIFNLHNHVNNKLKQKEFEYTDLEKTYNIYNFQKLIIGYINLSNNINYNERMMLYTMKRKEFLKNLLDYFKENIHKYNIVV